MSHARIQPRSLLLRFLPAAAVALLTATACSSGTHGNGTDGGSSDSTGDGGSGGSGTSSGGSGTGATGTGTGGTSTGGTGTGGKGTGGTGTGGTSTGTDGGAPLGCTGTPTGPVFYVATTGNDANAGSLTAPWATISHAMSTVTAGATVMVRAGVYAEQVEIGVSGAPGSPITLQSYPGETAIVDGTTVPVSDGVGLIDVDSRSHLVLCGLEVRNWTTTKDVDATGIMVQGSAADVQILDNHVHHIVTTVESTGSAHGIAIEGTTTTAISQVVLQGNEVDSLRTGWSESVTINGNVDGFVVANNTIHDNDNIGLVIAGAYKVAPDPSLDMARNGVVRGNTIYNIASKGNPAYSGDSAAAGIYVDGGQGVLIELNVVHNADYGIAMESENSGHAASYVLARNNLVYYSNSGGLSVGGYASSVGGADHCAYINNTLYENITELNVGYHMSEVLYENNLAYDSGGDFQEGPTTGATFASNLNLQTGTIFVNPGTPPNGAVAVSLLVAAGALSQVQGKGTELGCPSGWTCPAAWGASLNGTLDAAGNPRTKGAAVDIGAYEAE